MALWIARGLTQRELAERLGISGSLVSRDEPNEYHGITIEHAQPIECSLVLDSQENRDRLPVPRDHDRAFLARLQIRTEPRLQLRHGIELHSPISSQSQLCSP